MGRLSTHVLDVSRGKPAEGVRWTLYKLGEVREKLSSGFTNGDGRTDQFLLDGPEIEIGSYEVIFEVAEYFMREGFNLPSLPFLDYIPIRFSISSQDQNYHVPLLVSPYGYSTYRGS
jgi:5-hydroxyisourate hydrolase